MDRSMQYRQGDVLLIPCNALPRWARPLAPPGGVVVLAHGEVTGHAHTMMAERVRYFREDGSGRGFIQVHGGGPAALQHQEHAPVLVEPGLYEVRRQREYRPRTAVSFIVD